MGITEPLPPTGTVDLRTRGRRSGEDRWVEIWFVRVEARMLITGTPGRRGWLANLQVDPNATVRFRDPAREVAVAARVVTDPVERRRLIPLIWQAQPWYAGQGHSLDAWVSDAPIVEVVAA